ncbi:MAG: hypothetical protein ABIS74_17975 [Ferruginibacter sp.]
MERSYAKKSYKSTPVGVRFNLELEKIAMEKSKAETRQQLVDFLLENYVNGDQSEKAKKWDRVQHVFNNL